MCNDDKNCKAFTFINPPLFRLLRPDFTSARTCHLKSSCSENTLHRNVSGVYTYFKGLGKTGATVPLLVNTTDPVTDKNTTTCITSGDVKTSASNPVYSVQVNDVTTKTMEVQIYYGETVDNEMCNQLEKVLFTYFPSEGSCGYYKECALVWECHVNRICEFQCSCPRHGNGTCKFDVLRNFSEDVEWTICDIRV